MAYEILQWNLGTGVAQNFTLRGTGEHEGTNVTISAREADDIIRLAEQRLRLEHHDYRERSHSLLRDRPPPDERLRRALAEYLDRRFMLAHVDRTAREAGLDASIHGVAQNPARDERFDDEKAGKNG